MALKIDPWSFPDPVPVPEAGDAGNSIVLAGGCFWCTEAVNAQLDGVLTVRPGYAGGSAATANYDDVCTGTTGHAEAIEIAFDPARIGLGQILKIFFSIAHDPTQLNRQGPDVGDQYRSGIWTVDEEQKRVAGEVVRELGERKTYGEKPIVTVVEAVKTFWPAEDYHQQYIARTGAYCHVKNPW
mgnify:CR=1 FL=1